MPLSTLPELLQALAACRLLSPEAVSRVGVESAGRSVEDVLRQLVQQHLLTRWQADRLLAGQTGFHFGKYLVLDQLGVGGMGSVFLARQSGMDRVVALKVMSRKLIRDAPALARFQREVQAAAALQHPNIVLALDADSRQGMPYLVMEYVSGEDLRAVLRRQGPLPIGLACEYARQTALGLQHAGERGMIHRDIKPANLMLTRTSDGRPLVKILDFGLARFQSESQETGDITRTGEIMGTPDYISPEQATDTHTADIRSDIYSLGCTLFHWLTGTVPFPGKSVMERLMARATREPPSPAELRPEVSPELVAVLGRMLDRDPANRYQTPVEVANALAPFCRTTTAVETAAPAEAPVAAVLSEDSSDPGPSAGELQQFLAGLEAEGTSPSVLMDTQRPLPDARSPGPVVVTPVSRLQRKVARQARGDRRQTLLAAALFTGIAILVAGVAVWLSGNRSTLVIHWPLDERDGAKLFVDGREIRLPDQVTLEFPGPVGPRTAALSRAGYEPLEFHATLGRGGSETVPMEWVPTATTRRSDLWETLAEKWPAPTTAASSPTEIAGRRRELIEFQRQHPGTREAVAAAENARGLPWPVDSWPTPSGRQTEPQIVGILGNAKWKYNSGSVTSVAFDASGQRVLASGPDARLSIWDLASGRRTQRFPIDSYPIYRMVRTPDPERVLIATSAGQIALCSLTDGQLVWDTKWSNGIYGFVTASHNGKQVFAGSFNSSIKRLDPATGAVLTDIAPATDGYLRALVASATGRYLAAIRDERFIVWDWDTGADPRDLSELPDGYNNSADFSADERWLVCPDFPKAVRVWDTASWTARNLPNSQRVTCLAVHPTKPWVALASSPSASLQVPLRIVDLDEFGVERSAVSLPLGPVSAMAWSPDGSRLVAGDELGHLAVWSPEDGAVLGGGRDRITAFAISPDGETVFAGDLADQITPWKLSDGASATPWTSDANRLSALAVSHDGRWLASGGLTPQPVYGRRITFWDAGDHRQLRDTTPFDSNVMAMVASPDDQLLAAALFDGTTRLFEVATGNERQSLPGCEHTRMDAFSVAFHPGSKLLATGYWLWEKPVRLWDLSTTPASEKRSLTGHTNNVRSVTFTPLGQWLISGSLDETVRIWQSESGKTVDYLPSHAGGAYAVAVSADGQWLAVGEGSGHVSLWSLSGKRIVPDHRLRVGPASESILHVQFTPDSRHLLALVDNGTIAIVRLAEHVASR
jgi:serine/threonine protein kinase/WD40 repeat protein